MTRKKAAPWGGLFVYGVAGAGVAGAAPSAGGVVAGAGVSAGAFVAGASPPQAARDRAATTASGANSFRDMGSPTILFLVMSGYSRRRELTDAFRQRWGQRPLCSRQALVWAACNKRRPSQPSSRATARQGSLLPESDTAVLRARRAAWAARLTFVPTHKVMHILRVSLAHRCMSSYSLAAPETRDAKGSQ